MESSQIPLPGSLIFATYLFKASNTLLNSTEYTITRKEKFSFLAYKSCLDTAMGGELSVTLTSKVVVYTLQLRGQSHNPNCRSHLLSLWYVT
jgi:hypothetical protein